MRKTASPNIALITDFGIKDWYPGSIKGQILRQHPDAKITDITHSIPPGNVWYASYVLAACVEDFPKETLFVVVVDPGVGTRRECMIGRIGDATIICPNNGIVSHCIHYLPDQCGPFYEILPEHTLNKTISSTFHGRDIMAPIAGRISAGNLRVEDLGTVIHQVVRLPISKPEIKRGIIFGSIQYIDHFGNAITDISQKELGLFSIKPTACLEVKNTIISLKTTFAEADIGAPLTYIGSNGFLEIAVNRRNAAKQLELKIGDPVSFHMESHPDVQTSIKDILPGI